MPTRDEDNLYPYWLRIGGLEDFENDSLDMRELHEVLITQRYEIPTFTTQELSDAINKFARSSSSWLETLNLAWSSLGDDYELGDEAEYVDTDPISFDELMGGALGDN